VVSSKKSTRKSTAKKTLWSEVVRRETTTQKGGAKIVKPVIVKSQKIKAAVTAVVSIICFAIVDVAYLWQILLHLLEFYCNYHWQMQNIILYCITLLFLLLLRVSKL